MYRVESVELGVQFCRSFCCIKLSLPSVLSFTISQLSASDRKNISRIKFRGIVIVIHDGRVNDIYSFRLLHFTIIHN